MGRKQRRSARKKRQADAARRENKLRIISPECARNAPRLPVDLTGMGAWQVWKLSRRFPDGFYEDTPFCCKGCGAVQLWKAGQQKWWFEVAQGNPDSTAVRCRECRAKERQRIAEARRVHLEGLERKCMQQTKNLMKTAL